MQARINCTDDGAIRYFIEGSALLVHPFTRTDTLAAAFTCPGPYSSIMGITPLQIHQFTVSIKELAEWFGLEVARVVVDECLAQRQN